MEHCPQCNTMVSVEVLGAYVKCESCGMRFPKPRKKRSASRAVRAPLDDGGELGIHPALARRYHKPSDPGSPGGAGELTTDDVDPVPSVQLSPSLVEETRRKRGRTPAPEVPPYAREEEATAVESKPGALSSSSGIASAAHGDSDVHDPGRQRGESTRPLRPSFEKPSTPRRQDEGSASSNDTPLQRSAVRPPAPKVPMPVLPGLQMIGEVGKGAMGRVLRALDEQSGEEVAVKVLAPELAAKPDFVRRFEREAAALKRVSHPGVVAIRGSGSHGGQHYLVMPFIEGVSLRRILDGGPLTPGRALDFARQITQGLGAAHEKSVIHRDLKPENILVERVRAEGDEEERERLVLVDFGLAGIGDEGEDPHPNLTKSRMTMGTVNYMAPEQRLDAKRVDQRADLYAAGVILYELLTGDLPLGRFALPRERGLPLPESVDDCVHKALARAADERFQSAALLDEALARIQAELSRAASMDTLVGRSLLMDSEAEDDGDDEDAPLEEISGSVRSLAPRISSSEKSTASGKNVEWHTAPPWVKRPELLWGVLALALGAGAGVFLSVDEEATALSDDAGPRLVVEDSGAGARVSLSDDAAAWQREDGWSASGSVVSFAGSHITPAAPALLQYPDTLHAAAVSARAVVFVERGTPQGAAEPVSYAGVMLRTATDTLVGVMRFSDGTCGVLELDEESARVSPFRCPSLPGPMEVGLSCTLADNKCLVDAGGAPEAEYEVTLEPGPLSLALACAGRRCSFTNANAAVDGAPAGASGQGRDKATPASPPKSDVP